MAPQTYLLNLVNNCIEISFSVLSLGVWGGGAGGVKVEIKATSAQPTELELDWAGLSLAKIELWWVPAKWRWEHLFIACKAAKTALKGQYGIKGVYVYFFWFASNNFLSKVAAPWESLTRGKKKLKEQAGAELGQAQPKLVLNCRWYILHWIY